MDTDAFAAFEEAKDPFDPAVAKSLEKNILAAGGSEEPAILYKRFRGRLPNPSAMIKARGLNCSLIKQFAQDKLYAGWTRVSESIRTGTFWRRFFCCFS